MNDSEKYVVIPDLHGQSEALKNVYKRYKNRVNYISLGDFIDRGPNSREVISCLVDIGAIALMGNHEWVLMAALLSRDDESKEVWRHKKWLPPRRLFRYENNLLQSYGIDSINPDECAEAFISQAKEIGHLAFLHSLKTFYETEQFVAIHAGLDADIPWDIQRANLLLCEARVSEGNYDDEPDQLFDKKWKRATQPTARPATEKIVVSGHAHNRTYVDGSKRRRVKLASRLEKGLPLFVWESWTQEVIAIDF